MNLHFAPMACSLATRIALYEAGAPASFTPVNLKSKSLADGSSFLDLAPLGQVPALLIDDGTVITESTAVLQYVADRFPESKLAPPSGLQRTRLQQWLGFIGTELHKGIFIPLLDLHASDEVKRWGRDKLASRFALLQAHLERQDLLLDEISVADAYLFTILNWTRVTGIDLSRWPAIAAYHQRLAQRPAFRKATAEEWALYQAEEANKNN